MSITQIGRSAKKETVYNGPDLSARPVRNNGGAAAAGTVATVYSGPTPGIGVSAGSAGTVYDPVRQRAMLDHAALSATMQRDFEVSKAGRIFYAIAALTTVNTIMAAMSIPWAMGIGLGVARFFDQQLRRGGDAGAVMLVNGAAVAMFIILGIFAQHASKGALLIGFTLYGIDMGLLFMDGFVAHAPSLLVHSLLLVGIYRTFKHLTT